MCIVGVADLPRQLEKHNPGTVKLWESAGRARGLPLINYAIRLVFCSICENLRNLRIKY